VNVIQAQFVNLVRGFRIGALERAEADHYHDTAKKR